MPETKPRRRPRAHHPMQPVVYDGPRRTGVIRFKTNAIVEYLLHNGGINLNHLALLPFDREDREQFAQLIGYSVSGYGELSYVSRKSVIAADALCAELIGAK